MKLPRNQSRIPKCHTSKHLSRTSTVGTASGSKCTWNMQTHRTTSASLSPAAISTMPCALLRKIPCEKTARGVGMSPRTQRSLSAVAMMTAHWVKKASRSKSGLRLATTSLQSRTTSVVSARIGVVICKLDLTLQSYIAVHPWLMSMQHDILAAMRTAEPGYLDSTEWRLSNSCYDGPRHQIILPELWESMNRPNQNTW